MVVACAVAHAGGPRFVTGTGFAGVGPGSMMAFYTAQPLYFTDPGALSATVNHAQADAMVAAAAAVWNVPTSILTLAQGGALAEHVSGANAFFDGSEMVFPADVVATNYLSKPIAVVYDTDGSVTDLLLGEGASAPASCRQNGVTESVDGFSEYGQITHAVIVVNGRCVGALPESLLQLQYQVMRAFGRVVGLAWSQTNDNVFTGSPTPTAAQMAYWPVMHPMDVLCGPYTYQCMVNPFVLRADDLSALALLYPVNGANLVAGKTLSLTGGDPLTAYVGFPTGQMMEMVNVTVRRELGGTSFEEQWETVSGVSGVLYQQNGGNPVVGAEPADENVGRFYPSLEGLLLIGMVSVGGDANLYLTTEAINPLYTGDKALGPFERPVVVPSGTATTSVGYSEWPDRGYQFDFNLDGAAASCAPGNDGGPGAPAAADPSGWWTGQMCGPGHQSWWGVSVKAGRSWTIETTALDETGAATNQKAQPVVGVWNASDSVYQVPTVAAQAVAMNGLAPGMTQVLMAATATDASVQMVVADQFGGGRPDFFYRQRVLYADSVAPGSVGAGGGRITVTGMGFKQGNAVLVNGVAAKVQSWSATQIVAVAPSAVAAGSPTGAVDVAVVDATTGGSTVASAVLVYTTAVDFVQIVSAPTALETGVVAVVPFAVRVFASDGVTALAGASVRFAVTAGAAGLGCGAVSGSGCVVTTDSTGLAETTVAGVAAGAVTLTATEVSGGANVQVSVVDVDPVRSASVAMPEVYVAVGAAASWTVTLAATQDGVAAVGVPVVWSGSGFGAVTGEAMTGAGGDASAVVEAASMPVGAATVTGCVWSTVCASWTAVGVAAPQWVVGAKSGAGQSVAYTASLQPVTLLVTDGAGHAVQGAPVTVYQTVDAWEGSCPAVGRCPAAAVLASSVAAAVSDANGLVVVSPLEVAGVPEVVNVAAAAGTAGFVTVVLEKVP